VPLRPGDGVCHSWVNRLLIPDTVGTGGDSHTRFPIGISFPAGSGLVALPAPSVSCRSTCPSPSRPLFRGVSSRHYPTRRGERHPVMAIRKGLLTVPKKNRRTSSTAHPGSGGSAELDRRAGVSSSLSRCGALAAAASIQLSVESVATFLRSGLALHPAHDCGWLSGCRHPGAARQSDRVWLKNPQLLKATPMPSMRRSSRST